MKFAYVIVTHNRRQRLIQTLTHLYTHTHAPTDTWQTIVVDNASTDGTADAVLDRFSDTIELIKLSDNIGMPARNIAIKRTAAQYIVILDDDSYPIDDAVIRSIDYMDDHPRVAAVVGRAILPDGRAEASAMPSMMIGCATCIRKSALDEVGLFDPTLFIQAEEHDLSFRLLNAGHSIKRFEDIKYHHEKHPAARSSSLTTRMDLRNNLVIVRRYLPQPIRAIYRRDWTQRYVAIARHSGNTQSAIDAITDLRHIRANEKSTPLNPNTIEHVFQWKRQTQLVATWATRHNIKNIVLGDLGKNIYATYRACRYANLFISAIANRAPAFADLRYRGIDLLNDIDALKTRPDGIIITNINPAQMQTRHDQLHARFDGPILTLWHPQFLTTDK